MTYKVRDRNNKEVEIEYKDLGNNEVLIIATREGEEPIESVVHVFNDDILEEPTEPESVSAP